MVAKTKKLITGTLPNVGVDGFALGNSKLAHLIAELDWSQTSLGPVAGWPQSLRTSINIVLDSTVPIVMLWGPDGIMIYNDAYSIFAGGRHPQLLGSKVLEGWPEVADFNAHVMEQGLAGKTLSYNDQELTLYRNNVPEQVWMNLNYSPIRDETGQPAGVLAVVLETTGQIVAERQNREAEATLAAERRRLEESEVRFRDIANTLPLVVWTAAPDGGLTFISQQWEEIYGNPVNRSLGTGWARYVHPDDVAEVGASWAESLQTGKNYDTEFRVRYKQNGYRWVLVRAVAIRGENGEIVTWYGTNTDLHDKRAAEEEIRALNRDLERRVDERTVALTVANKELARSNVELQDFAYVASHDLQEPLRKITAFAGLLKSDYQDTLPAEAKVYINGLQKSSIRMRTLISDLLMYSRVATQAQPFKKVDISALLREVQDDLQTRIDETAATITSGKLGTLEGDPLQLRLLLQNLISNAIKYRKPADAPMIKLRSEVTKTQCTISVQDNGIGFNEEYTDRIFTIFQRLHGRGSYEGTGIGLAICKKIVDRHGGTITAKSKEGEGSTFIVTLPIEQLHNKENI